MRGFVITFVVCVTAATLNAQTYRLGQQLPRLAAGPFVEFGGGLTTTTTTCQSCARVTAQAAGLRTALGWQFAPRLRFGIAIDGSVRDEHGTRERLYNLAIEGTIGILRGGHVRIGLGPTGVRQTTLVAGEKVVTSRKGIGWSVGAGYEVPLSPELVLVPFAGYRNGGTGDLHRDGGIVATDHSFHTVEIGATMRWHLRSLIWPTLRDKAPG